MRSFKMCVTLSLLSTHIHIHTNMIYTNTHTNTYRTRMRWEMGACEPDIKYRTVWWIQIDEMNVYVYTKYENADTLDDDLHSSLNANGFSIFNQWTPVLAIFFVWCFEKYYGSESELLILWNWNDFCSTIFSTFWHSVWNIRLIVDHFIRKKKHSEF